METHNQAEIDRRADEVEQHKSIRWNCDMQSASTFTDEDLPSDEELREEEMTMSFGTNWRDIIANQHLEGRLA